MKVQIKQVNAYEITIGGKTYTGFKRNDDWRGMISFSGPQGQVIVADSDKPFYNLFDKIFNDADKSGEFDIVQISPDLTPLEGGHAGRSGPNGDPGPAGGES